ncbi:hypothetical protein H6F46_06875 [Limnothrix sp. FACHB-1083]|uniref:hypothetical protein n=1 Tax=unclassified Limnothrix TaxID=2632864 RepID=UPI0016814EA3|nr:MULTISPECIES: hypothetical protein [unclassified Limnothrix]MBD2160416.1 hypothetical protein [Limnothrix sp. FACHB-1083]
MSLIGVVIGSLCPAIRILGFSAGFLCFSSAGFSLPTGVVRIGLGLARFKLCPSCPPIGFNPNLAGVFGQIAP